MAELTKLGRYELKRVLGRGAMGVVYEGLDPSLSRRVAVKTILKSIALDEETERSYSERFVREAKAVARLNHPNIVQVFDFGVENEIAYLVMEFIEGRELRACFEARERFEPVEAVRIMGDLLEALEFAHEAGVVHRDVKPANVMLDGRRRVKLTDFGVARLQDSDRSAAGTMVGTPAFMSPEQISGGKVDRRTDIFSAGVVLYQLLTGEQPFSGEGAWTVAKKIMQDDPPAPSSMVQSVSPAFDTIVARALAKNPALRFASATEFSAALRAALTGAPAGLALPKAKPKPAPTTSEAEVEFWRSIQNSADPAEFEVYLEQFPEGTYSGLARIKLAKLREPLEAARKAAEEKARLEAEERARREAAARAKSEADEKARREAETRARREAEENARREAAAKAKREAEENARREAAAKAKREAEEKARRETEEKIRQAQAQARLRQQEEAAAKARTKAKAEENSTVAIRPAARSKSMAVPAAVAAVVLIGGVAAYLFTGRTPPPAPVAAVAPAKPEATPAAPAVDPEKIRRETEERLRKEFAEKAAAERAALEKSLAEKIAAEAAAAKKVAEAKSAAEKAAAEKAVAAAAAARVAAEKAAAQKAAADRANAEKLAAEQAAAARAAAEKAAAEKAAAERAAAEKAAAEKAAAEKLAAAKPAPDSHEAKLERFTLRVGRERVFKQEPQVNTSSSIMMGDDLRAGEVIYVNDGYCPPGRIREVTGIGTAMGTGLRGRPSRCISLDEGGTAAARPPAAKPVAPSPAAAVPAATADHNALLDRFIQRKGRDKVVAREPAPEQGVTSGMVPELPMGQVVYVNDGSCGPGAIKEVTGGSAYRNLDRSYRCISLADDKPIAARPVAPRPASAPAAAAPAATTGRDAQLERFAQRVGRNKVLKQEPPLSTSPSNMSLLRGEVVYVDDGSCGSGRIREVTGTDEWGTSVRTLSRPSRCVPLE